MFNNVFYFELLNKRVNIYCLCLIISHQATKVYNSYPFEHQTTLTYNIYIVLCKLHLKKNIYSVSFFFFIKILL